VRGRHLPAQLDAARHRLAQHRRERLGQRGQVHLARLAGPPRAARLERAREPRAALRLALDVGAGARHRRIARALLEQPAHVAEDRRERVVPGVRGAERHPPQRLELRQLAGDRGVEARRRVALHGGAYRIGARRH
jgi:hypothetical protein